jgi:hypothetical protein
MQIRTNGIACTPLNSSNLKAQVREVKLKNPNTMSSHSGPYNDGGDGGGDYNDDGM